MNRLFEHLSDQLLDIHPVFWAERNVSLRGEPLKIYKTGRDYLLELYNYIAFVAPSPKALPVVIVKSRKVEMSTTVSLLALYFMIGARFIGVCGLHAFPFVDQSHDYSNAYFDALVRQSGLLAYKDPLGTYSVTHKQFTNGNQLFIEGASTEGKRLRSMTVDFVFFDEVQDMTRQAQENTREAMTHSIFGRPGMGLEIAFGTPSFKGSNFERLWEESDQRYFHLRCPHCDEYFIITMECCTTEYNVECPACKKEEDKRLLMPLGKWIPTRHTNVLRRGYHLNQLIVPYITIDTIRLKQQTMGPIQFLNEVLGEFCSGGTTALTFEEVLTKVKDPSIGLREFIFPTESKQYLGIDWGSRTTREEEGESGESGSYTAIVILTPLGDRKFRVEFCQQVTEERTVGAKADLAEELWRRYSIVGCCADMGYGHNEVAELQRRFGDRVKGVWSSGNLKAAYSYDPNLFLLTINRDVVLTEVFEIIRQKALTIPFQDPARVEWLVRHIVSMNVEAASLGGMTRLRYSKTSKPCDGLMALLYAYLAYRFDETQGFKNIHSKTEGRSFPKPRLAHMPSRGLVSWHAANVFERTMGRAR